MERILELDRKILETVSRELAAPDVYEADDVRAYSRDQIGYQIGLLGDDGHLEVIDARTSESPNEWLVHSLTSQGHQKLTQLRSVEAARDKPANEVSQTGKTLGDWLGTKAGKIVSYSVTGLVAVVVGALFFFTAIRERPTYIGVLGCLGTACKVSSAGTLPGSVVAFDLRGGCPKGWSDFDAAAGRFILGANPNQMHQLSKSTLGSDGGAESVVLDEPHMPIHNHNQGEFDRLLSADGNVTVTRSDNAEPNTEPNIGRIGNAPIVSQGGGLPHNNMPPYIALYFCKKD